MGDALIEAYGSTFEEALENAALALFEVMTDTTAIRPVIKDEVSIRGEDKESLFYNWLEHFLVTFDLEGKVYSRFKVGKLKRIDKGYAFKAEAWGETFDPTKHPPKTAIKAVTYHMMRIVEKKDSVALRFLLDL